MNSNQLYQTLKNKFFVIAGPNVIESEEHVLEMCGILQRIFAIFETTQKLTFIFKVSFDKANRTSISSYRGVDIQQACNIFKKIKEKFNFNIITDIHEPHQAEIIAPYVDIIQIPAFLCRQTDLLIAAGKTGKIIQIKKGQFCGTDTMKHSVEKIRSTGNNNVIVCDRGNMFGYHDMVVDPRNLVLLRSPNNLVTMDITHCLQKPGSRNQNGSVCAGGNRELIPTIGRMAVAVGVNGIFMEVHNNPDQSKCDAPTQFPVGKIYNFIKELLRIRSASKGLTDIY